MTSLRAWLRPPRNLLVFFILLVCIPAAALIGLSFRLLDLDWEKRQSELLNQTADEAVQILNQDFATLKRRLENSTCAMLDVADDSVCVTFRGGGIEAVPRNRVPYYPLTQPLKEVPSSPFEEGDFHELSQQDLLRASGGGTPNRA